MAAHARVPDLILTQGGGGDLASPFDAIGVFISLNGASSTKGKAVAD